MRHFLGRSLIGSLRLVLLRSPHPPLPLSPHLGLSFPLFGVTWLLLTSFALLADLMNMTFSLHFCSCTFVLCADFIHFTFGSGLPSPSSFAYGLDVDVCLCFFILLHACSSPHLDHVCLLPFALLPDLPLSTASLSDLVFLLPLLQSTFFGFFCKLPACSSPCWDLIVLYFLAQNFSVLTLLIPLSPTLPPPSIRIWLTFHDLFGPTSLYFPPIWFFSSPFYFDHVSYISNPPPLLIRWIHS
jgi:hypothetical protein